MAEPSPVAAFGAPSDEPSSGTCRHCRRPITRRPFYLDRPSPGPLVWVHSDEGIGLQTCRTRPREWDGSDWPVAEPAGPALPVAPVDAAEPVVAMEPARPSPVPILPAPRSLPPISLCGTARSALGSITSLSLITAVPRAVIGVAAGVVIGIVDHAAHLAAAGAKDGRTATRRAHQADSTLFGCQHGDP